VKLNGQRPVLVEMAGQVCSVLRERSTS